MSNRTALSTQTLRGLTTLVVAGIPLDLPEADAQYWLDSHAEELHQGMSQLMHRTKPTDNWLDVILERQKLVFCETSQSEIDFLAATLDDKQELVEDWQQRLQLVPICLPRLVFTDEFLAGKAPMSQFYREQVATGSIKRMTNGQLIAVESIGLDGIVALVDTRLKPSYNGGKQMFSSDGKFLGPIIKQLRKLNKLEGYQYGPVTSRFGVSAEEWQDKIKPTLDELPEFKDVVNWRLETYPEFWTLGQTLRIGDGDTNTWVWFEEFFEDASFRLFGGSSDYGGLSYAYCSSVDYHWNYKAVRPLGVLATLPLGS